MTPEAKVKKRVRETLDTLGAWYFMPAMGAFGRAGIPDFVGGQLTLITPDMVGKTFAILFGIEAKAGRNKATALQLKELQKIQDAGGIALLINEDNVEFEIERRLKCLCLP